jgi:hypothetical protein
MKNKKKLLSAEVVYVENIQKGNHWRKRRMGKMKQEGKMPINHY